MGRLLGVPYRGVRFYGPVQAREAVACWFCTRPIDPGEAVFRPLDNGAHSKQRLHEACAETVATQTPPQFVLRGMGEEE